MNPEQFLKEFYAMSSLEQAGLIMIFALIAVFVIAFIIAVCSKEI